MNRQVQRFIDALARQGIAVDAARMDPGLDESLSKVRLRFDRGALRFVDDVQSALNGLVPDGRTLVFTITAPIRLASKTATALEERVRSCLTGRTRRIDLTETILGNQIRVRVVRGGTTGTSKVIGFVHNADTDPEILFDMTQSLFL